MSLLCAEAAQILSRHSVDVIVSDERMPGMSGVDFLKRMQDAFSAIERILMTGNATASVAIGAINEASVHRMFAKPCSVIELAIAIRNVLGYPQCTRKKDKQAEQELAEEA